MKNDNDKESLKQTTRFTLILPLHLSIKLEIEREKAKQSKSEWIATAIEEKIERNEKEKNKISSELEEIKEILYDLKKKIV